MNNSEMQAGSETPGGTLELHVEPKITGMSSSFIDPYLNANDDP